MRLGVATIAHGRPRHLARQATAVAGLQGIERYVVVMMGEAPAVTVDADVIIIPADPDRLPLAAARNRALQALGDVDLAILLDVDCIPSAQLARRYAAAMRQLDDRPALLCGPVGYLDPLGDDADGPTAAEAQSARERVIRGFPGSGIAREPRHELFWSLSFAVTPAAHEAIGHFDEGFVGYGAEDTDYGLRAAEAGVALWLVAGAWAYHQAHPPSPSRQLAAVVENVRRFHARWGFWPMPDRLAQFADQGLISWSPEAARCELRVDPRGPVQPRSAATDRGANAPPPSGAAASCGPASCN